MCNIGSIHKRADLAKKLLVLTDVELQDLVCNKVSNSHDYMNSLCYLFSVFLSAVIVICK